MPTNLLKLSSSLILDMGILHDEIEIGGREQEKERKRERERERERKRERES